LRAGALPGPAQELQPFGVGVSQACRLKPHRVRGFKILRDPKFVEKLEDIVGLDMSPPEHALARCCDEKNHETRFNCVMFWRAGLNWA
jgi:hypothetical protein